MEKRGIHAFVAEFIGTFALVFTIIIAVSLYHVGGQVSIPNGLSVPFIALAHALILFFLIQTLGGVSGAHFNPAVTFALGTMKKIGWSTAVVYIIVQLAAAVTAALLVKQVLPGPAGDVNYAANLINTKEIGLGAGMVFEIIGTFFLVFAILGVAVNPAARQEWAALAIGTTLALGVLLFAPLTGAGFNPARSFGPALVSGEWGSAKDFLLAYVLSPVIGALLAVGLYQSMIATRSAKEEPPPLDMEPGMVG